MIDIYIYMRTIATTKNISNNKNIFKFKTKKLKLGPNFQSI